MLGSQGVVVVVVVVVQQQQRLYVVVCSEPFSVSCRTEAGMNSLVFRDFELVVCSRSRPADSSAASPPRHRGRATRRRTTRLLMLVRPHGSRWEGQTGLDRAGPGQSGSGYSWCRDWTQVIFSLQTLGLGLMLLLLRTDGHLQVYQCLLRTDAAPHPPTLTCCNLERSLYWTALTVKKVWLILGQTPASSAALHVQCMCSFSTWSSKLSVEGRGWFFHVHSWDENSDPGCRRSIDLRLCNNRSPKWSHRAVRRCLI